MIRLLCSASSPRRPCPSRPTIAGRKLAEVLPADRSASIVFSCTDFR